MIAITANELRRAADIKEQIERLKREFSKLLGLPDQAEEKYHHKLRPLPKRRIMSPEARAKIAAAARRRWRNARKAGNNHL